MWKIALYLFTLLPLASQLTAQCNMAEARDSLLAQADLGAPDTSRYMAAARQLARQALCEGNLSIARNATTILIDMADRYAAVTDRQIAAAYLANAEVTYKISRRHPTGIQTANTALAAARRAEDDAQTAEALYHRARFERGHRKPDARVATLDTLSYLTKHRPDLGRWQAHTILEQARDQKETGQLLAAKQLGEAALNTFADFYPQERFLALDLLGDLAGKLGNYDAGVDYYNQAVTAYFPEATADENGIQRPVTQGLTTYWHATLLLNHRARFFRAQGRPELALTDYYNLIDLRSRQRDANTVDRSRIRQSRILMEFLAEAIDIHHDLQDEDPEHAWRALALSERLKAYSLLTHLENRETAGKKADTLRRQIAALERAEPGYVPKSPELALAQLELSTLLSNGRAKGQGSRFYTVDELKAAVAELDGGMLQYATSYRDSYLFYVDEGGTLTLRQLPDTYNTMMGIFGWRATIEESSFNAKSFQPKSVQDSMNQAFLAQGLDMKRRVLPGINPDSLPKTLLIIPDNALNFLPFAALPVDTVAAMNGPADLRYLIDDHRLSYAYSLRHHNALNALPDEPRDQGLIAFAPEYQGETTASDVIASRGAGFPLESDQDSITGLKRLAHNVAEARQITELMPGAELLAGAEATKQAFLDRLGKSNILHLSSHGAMSPRHPKYSFLAFSQEGDELDETELIYYNDLPSYGVPADLVVLSACETSIGMVAPGESALTMAAAFIDAGAHSVVSNLWSVDDAATKDLVTYFYEGLAEGQDRLTAVNDAQRKMRSEGGYTHPFYWGALTLYGERGQIAEARPRVPWYWVGAGAGVLLVGMLVFFGARH